MSEEKIMHRRIPNSIEAEQSVIGAMLALLLALPAQAANNVHITAESVIKGKKCFKIRLLSICLSKNMVHRQ